MTDHSDHGACEAMGAPGEWHKKLEPFVGTFKATVKMWMGPGDPMVFTGVMTSSMELGGRFLKQVYESDENDGPFPYFAGRGYWGYNTMLNKYEGFWIDTACTFMQTESGDVDESGKVWTMIGEMIDPQSGKNMKKRSIITLGDNDHNSMEMFFVTPDGKENKGMEIHYTRV